MKSIIINIFRHNWGWLVILLTIVALVLLTSCRKDDDGFTHYKIKQGKTWTRHGLHASHGKKSIQFQFKVNDTWRIGENGGINKVGGIGHFWNHTLNSCRLGWKDLGEVVVYMYVWDDGEEHRFAIDTLVNGTYYCDIGRVGDEWHLTLNGKTFTCPAGKDFESGVRLFPNLREPVDQDVIIPIKWE